MRKNKNSMGLEEKIGYTFHNPALLKQSMVHASSANESQGKHVKHNERLEFLGDAVLQLIISDYYYHHFPQAPEGELTLMRASVVNEQVLAQVAIGLDLGQDLHLGKGEENSGGRERTSILADAWEALIGAVYLDGGYERARELVETHMSSDLEAVKNGLFRQDYKTTLQEIIQKQSGRGLRYRTVSQEGPDHAKVFQVQVESEDGVLGSGSGKTKKDAEQEAARDALSKMDEHH